MLVPATISWQKQYLDKVNEELGKLFPSRPSTLIERAATEALAAGGKRVRATLALLWCEEFSGEYAAGTPLAVAYELAHASALVQDDIIDHSDMRRGRESIVAKYGLSNAILASDLLMFNVPKMVARYAKLESGRLAKIFDLVGEACKAATWGEFLDLEMARLGEGTEQEYEEMIRLKTSSLLSAPSASGAMLGGATEEQFLMAEKFGEMLGMAYQVQDDALDLVGDEVSLGKPVLTDLRGGKKSLVLIHCAARCSTKEKDFILSLLDRGGHYSTAEISKLRDLIESKGSLQYARERVEFYTNKAKDVLKRLDNGAATTRLFELTDYLASRYY